MVNARHKEVLKALTSKGVEPSTSDTNHGNSNNRSSSSSEDLKFRGFTDEETKVFILMISRQQVFVCSFRFSIDYAEFCIRTEQTDNLKEMIQKELKEFMREGIMKDFSNETATYRDFMACDGPKFDGTLDLIANTRWLFIVEGAFRTSCYKEKNKVNFASNFLCDSAKMWLDGKVCEKGKEWLGRARKKISRRCLVPNMLRSRKLTKSEKSSKLLCKPTRR
nr:hypothetical protein [Tanacetum cinerariifolium]